MLPFNNSETSDINDWINPYQSEKRMISLLKEGAPLVLLAVGPIFISGDNYFKIMWGIALILAGIWIQRRNKLTAEKNLSDVRKKQTLVSYTQSLQNLVTILLEYSQSERNNEPTEKTISQVLSAGLSAMASSCIRLSVYILDETEVTQDETRLCLTLLACRGRFDVPRSSFEPDGSTTSKLAMERARERNSCVVQDCISEAAKEQTAKNAHYKSFAAFPLYSEKLGALGILFADAEYTYFWTVDHRTIGELLSRVLTEILEQKQERCGSELSTFGTELARTAKGSTNENQVH